MRTSKRDIDSLQLQGRDIALLRGLFESRIMTSAHVSTLFFDDKREAAKKRLQKLKSAGLIGERRRRAYEPSVLHLTGKAFALLRDQDVFTEYPPIGQRLLEKRALVSDLTLRHELDVMDMKAAFHAAIAKSAAYTVSEFCTWPLLHQFEAVQCGKGGEAVVVKPDGFIRIRKKDSDREPSEHTFFLEVDRSSETLDALVARAACYLDYCKSGGFAVKNGAPRIAYKGYPFRVLMVFKTAERRNNIAERLLQSNPPILTQTCLSTLEEATTNLLGPIWICPADYRDATKGTPFDPEHRRETWGYKRQTAREQWIEKHVPKFVILASS